MCALACGGLALFGLHKLNNQHFHTSIVDWLDLGNSALDFNPCSFGDVCEAAKVKAICTSPVRRWSIISPGWVSPACPQRSAASAHTVNARAGSSFSECGCFACMFGGAVSAFRGAIPLPPLPMPRSCPGQCYTQTYSERMQRTICRQFIFVHIFFTDDKTDVSVG